MSMSVVPAHQTLGYGIMGGKGHDIWAVPLCAGCHTIDPGAEHCGHKTFWNGGNVSKIIFEMWILYQTQYPNKSTAWLPDDVYTMAVKLITEGISDA